MRENIYSNINFTFPRLFVTTSFLAKILVALNYQDCQYIFNDSVKIPAR